MAYFKINGTDFSQYVAKLKIGKKNTFETKVNAMGNLMAKYKNSSYVVEVGIIPLDKSAMIALQNAINSSRISISFLDPATNQLKTITCINTEQLVEYYTIQGSNTKFKAFALSFTEAVTGPAEAS